MNEQQPTPPPHMPLEPPAPNPFAGPTPPLTVADAERMKRQTPEEALEEMIHGR